MEHRDDVGARLGMWIFIFTEILLFGGLFLVYAVMRSNYSTEFHQAAHHLNAFIGAINTVVLILSSAMLTRQEIFHWPGGEGLSL